MKVLVACEFSGMVREAFRKLGHEAYSCDLLDTEIPRPTIRRACRELISELQKKVEILTSPSIMDRSVP